MKQQIKAIMKGLGFERIGEEHLVTDINHDYTQNQKKILISYLDYQKTTRELASYAGHTNRQEMMQIIKSCIQMGFCIDVCGCMDAKVAERLPENYYDYILGFGTNFFLAKEKSPKAKSILYMTENPYYISYEREMERLRYFTERTGRKYHLERTGVYYSKDDEKKADAVICLGDASYIEGNGRKCIRIWPSALKNPTFQLSYQNKKKNSFMVYGVDGFIHKGNDLLIEVFAKHPEWKLYVCGKNGENKAKQIGYTNLPENIHIMGAIDTLSETFNEIVKECYYLLLPSCSEAPSTAVLTGMRHGVIPIVSRGIGLDNLIDYCKYFDDYHIGEIEKRISEAVKENDEVLQEMSRCIMEYADKEYTLDAYTQGIRCALEELCE